MARSQEVISTSSSKRHISDDKTPRAGAANFTGDSLEVLHNDKLPV